MVRQIGFIHSDVPRIVALRWSVDGKTGRNGSRAAEGAFEGCFARQAFEKCDEGSDVVVFQTDRVNV